MKQNWIEIDINNLDEDELRALAAMTYKNGDMETTKRINERLIFITA